MITSTEYFNFHFYNEFSMTRCLSCGHFHQGILLNCSQCGSFYTEIVEGETSMEKVGFNPPSIIAKIKSQLTRIISHGVSNDN